MQRGKWIFAAVIFLSAGLLFQVQFITAKYILPWFGGTPGVWTTCLLFFQVLLTAGYAYSHYIVTRTSNARQSRLHITLLAVSVVMLFGLALQWRAPILPGPSWKPQGYGWETARILRLLLVSVGLPFFLLSTTGPLLQRWFSNLYPQASVYSLYALSNTGSLLGLASYPVVIEPFLRMPVQAWLWTIGYVIFAMGCCAAAILALRWLPAPRVQQGGTPILQQEDASREDDPKLTRKLQWVLLAMLPSLLLLATTNTICQEVAVIPFLWALPLSVYLFTFIVCFARGSWYVPGLVQLGFGVAAVLLVVLRGNMSARWQISILVFAFFVCCMFCHGELYRRRPDAAHLTSFYFSISIGGALGGVFVSLLAPHIFSGFWEFWLGLLTCYVLVLVRLFRDRESWLRFSVVWLPIAILLWAFSLAAHEHVLRGFQRRQTWLLGALAIGTTIFAVRATLRKRKAGVESPALARVTRLLLVALFAMCGSIVFVRLWVDVRSAEWQGRNFYGVLRIRHVMNEEPKDNGYALFHGNTLHGFQFEDPARALEPTTYFGPKSGIGVAMQNHAYSVNKRSALRVGIVGLGAGTIAAYGQPGDDFRFYEINEDVVRIARGEIGRFSFLSKSPAAITVVPGDARISLERELQTKGSQNFDILVLDAFNSDAIPVHLLTTEAIQLYLHHLHDEHSVLALHISNRSLDLVPVVKGLAEHFHLKMERIISPKRGLGTVSEWMVLSYDPEFFARPNVKAAAREITPKRVPLWTDDYSNLLRIMQ